MKACEALTDGVGEGEQAYADGYRVRRVAGDGGADCLPREVGWSSASGLPETSAFNTPNSTAKAQPARDHRYPTRSIAFGALAIKRENTRRCGLKGIGISTAAVGRRPCPDYGFCCAERKSKDQNQIHPNNSSRVRCTNSEASRSRARYCCRSSFAAAEYWPCFVTARRMRAIPLAVFGPVLSPPWIRQRPFAMAGHWHGVPRLVLAPHRGAFEKSPVRLPFLSHPRRSSGLHWGALSSFVIARIPLLQTPSCLRLWRQQWLGPLGTH
jgi:hypothetical protein